MRRDQSAPQVGDTPDVTRQRRNLAAVMAQYIQDLTRPT
jgi:hypothetical protein